MAKAAIKKTQNSKKVISPKKATLSKQKAKQTGKGLDLTIKGTKILDLPNYQDVVDAHKRLSGVANKTPVMTSRTINK